MSTRGIRNNNPGNVKDFGIPWDGLADPEEMTPEQLLEETFCVFRAPWWGIRCMAKILLGYQVRYGFETVAEIVSKYAPKADNNPENAYIQFVCDRMEVQPDQPINLKNFQTMADLVRAMIHMENGEQPFDYSIVTGLILAGIEPDPGLVK